MTEPEIEPKTFWSVGIKVTSLQLNTLTNTRGTYVLLDSKEIDDFYIQGKLHKFSHCVKRLPDVHEALGCGQIAISYCGTTSSCPVPSEWPLAPNVTSITSVV